MIGVSHWDMKWTGVHFHLSISSIDWHYHNVTKNTLMATTINNTGEGTGAGTIVGIVVAVIIVALLFIYGLPVLRGTTATPSNDTNINVTLPSAGNTGGNTTGSGTGQ